MAVQSIGGMRAARHRRRLAATLRRFVAEAHDPLALVLSSSPLGLAMARSLVMAPDSPLYPPSPDGLLARTADETPCALDAW